jgi:hypothetical protein
MNCFLRPLLALSLTLFMVSSQSTAEPVGEDTYNPHKSYNFSIFGKYNSFRHGSIGSDIQSPLYRSFGGGMAFDVGFHKYMSAGAMLSFDTAKNEAFSLESTSNRLSAFFRPKITFWDSLTLFSRLSAGPSLMFAWPHRSIAMQGSPSMQEKIKEEFPAYDYNPAHFGVHSMAAIGLEYSPFSRLSFSLEWGIMAEYIFVSRSKFIRDLQVESLGRAENDKSSPESYRYFGYEMPLTLSVNMIF